MEERTVAKGGVREADGCDEERWRGRLVVDAQVGSDGGSFSLKECRGVSCADVVHVPWGWRCPHPLHLSHWHQSGRWGRRRGRETMRG